MKYCRFQSDSGPQYGEIADRNGVLWIERLLPPPEEDPWTKFAATTLFNPVPIDQATLLQPVVPSKIVCIGRNYKEHAAELGNEVPKEPLLFLKAPSSVIAHKQAIHKPAISQRVDFEGELAIVIGKRCTKIGPDEDVRKYIRGYTIVNDVTARDRQKNHKQWFIGKTLDTFCPMGPWITTSDEVEPENLDVKCWVNGELRQNANTRDLIFDIPSLVSTISEGMALAPGDIIATGTPAGVGIGFNPPKFLKSGDVVAIEISGLGRIENKFVADA
jgi:2-keto-4-pentenoate hydratase/2-oxohepta-3-ene-1,7-dioic acid hydratase in catechol pathway